MKNRSIHQRCSLTLFTSFLLCLSEIGLSQGLEKSKSISCDSIPNLDIRQQIASLRQVFPTATVTVASEAYTFSNNSFGEEDKKRAIVAIVDYREVKLGWMPKEYKDSGYFRTRILERIPLRDGHVDLFLSSLTDMRGGRSTGALLTAVVRQSDRVFKKVLGELGQFSICYGSVKVVDWNGGLGFMIRSDTDKGGYQDEQWTFKTLEPTRTNQWRVVTRFDKEFAVSDCGANDPCFSKEIAIDLDPSERTSETYPNLAVSELYVKSINHQKSSKDIQRRSIRANARGIYRF